jgi:hypothetical protein
MGGDIFLVNQLVNSMNDAVMGLENKSSEKDKIKKLILDIQKKLDAEILKL